MSEQIQFVWAVTFEQKTELLQQTEMMNNFAAMAKILAEEFAKKYHIKQTSSNVTAQRKKIKSR